MLAGLISDEDRRSAQKVPGLAQLPVLGRLFSSDNDTVNKTEVVLLITPRVLRNIERPGVRLEEFNSGTEMDVGRGGGGPLPPVSIQQSPCHARNRQPRNRRPRKAPRPPAAGPKPDAREPQPAMKARGFTLVELLIVVAIMALLASIAAPLAELSYQRGKEQELRTALREIREAIDTYKRAADDGKIEKSADSSGYPPSLKTLVEGVPDKSAPGKARSTSCAASRATRSAARTGACVPMPARRTTRSRARMFTTFTRRAKRSVSTRSRTRSGDMSKNWASRWSS